MIFQFKFGIRPLEVEPLVDLAAGLIDELVIYQAASVLGAGARGMFDVEPPADLAARTQFRLQEARRVGEDLRLIYIPATTAGKSS